MDSHCCVAKEEQGKWQGWFRTESSRGARQRSRGAKWSMGKEEYGPQAGCGRKIKHCLAQEAVGSITRPGVIVYYSAHDTELFSGMTSSVVNYPNPTAGRAVMQVQKAAIM